MGYSQVVFSMLFISKCKMPSGSLPKADTQVSTRGEGELGFSYWPPAGGSLGFGHCPEEQESLPEAFMDNHLCPTV